MSRSDSLVEIHSQRKDISSENFTYIFQTGDKLARNLYYKKSLPDCSWASHTSELRFERAT